MIEVKFHIRNNHTTLNTNFDIFQNITFEKIKTRK